MTIKIFFIILLVFILLGAVVFWPYEVSIKGEPLTKSTDRPNFPITVYSEDKGTYKGIPVSVTAVLIIPVDHFNQDDLLRVLKWYSSENAMYSDIVVHLYTDPKNAGSFVPRPRSLCQDDAGYVKIQRGKRETDEWFVYRRFLRIPVCSNRVILSGNYDGPWP